MIIVNKYASIFRKSSEDHPSKTTTRGTRDTLKQSQKDIGRAKEINSNGKNHIILFSFFYKDCVCTYENIRHY